MQNNTILSVQGLSVCYGHINAVKHADIEVRKGEMIVLIGANGAGKTTVLETILGIHRAAEGHIYFKGDPIENKNADTIVRRGVSLVPEGRGVFGSMSVKDNLLLGAYHNKRNTNDRLEYVFGAFPVLAERKDQIAGTLSGGERQMLAIGRALMGSPELIMVDEPSIGLAPKIVTTIFEILRSLNTKGYSILLAEQNAYKALTCAHRGYVLETGTVFLQGAAEELLNDSRVRQAYIGA